MKLISFVYVFIGAGFGGSLRYFLSTFLADKISVVFPSGTLAANLLGSLIIGIFIFSIADKDLVTSNIRLLVAVGFCGGLTTFSSFSYETLNLFRDSQYLLGFLNIALNLVLSFIGVLIGFLIAK